MNAMQRLARRLSTLAAIVIVIVGFATPAAGAAPPLLLDGKSTLYQRVLTRPGASIAPRPGVAGTRPVVPFTLYYVYGRSSEDGKSWLAVGPGVDGRVDGFLAESDTVAWRHAMSMSFVKPGGRDRVLFFRDRKSLEAMAHSPDAPAELAKIRHALTAGAQPPAQSGVIAAEPRNWVDPAAQFYLLPILEARTGAVKGFPVRLLRVASVTRDDKPNKPAHRTGAIVTYRTAITFVIDATSSMQPYIDATRRAMEEVLRQVDEANLGQRVRFGLVAYQDDPSQTPGMQYLTKVLVNPSTGGTRAQFLEAIGSLGAARRSTRAFAEDAYAGLDTALQRIDWSSFGGRYIVFVTDASAREGASPLASTGLSTNQLRLAAHERGVAIFAMHLRTPEGRKDHVRAENQYKALSAWPGQGSLYFPVQAGDAVRFQAQVTKMARTLVEQVRRPEKLLAEDGGARNRDEIEQSVANVGRAMVLAYLGRQEGTRAPPMFEAWAAQRDLAKPEQLSLSVRVLLTKNQLSDLQATLRRLVQAGERAQIDPSDFFNQLRSAALAIGRDASRLGQPKVRNLEQSGLMGEYLDGLPYQSNVMSIDQDGWTRMSVGEQQAILDDVKSKIALYQRFHDDVDRWVKLNDAAEDGERVYPVPIDALP